MKIQEATARSRVFRPSSSSSALSPSYMRRTVIDLARGEVKLDRLHRRELWGFHIGGGYVAERHPPPPPNLLG